MATRFRGYLPVVIDVETSGFEPERHGILEIAAVMLDCDAGELGIHSTRAWAVRPRADAEISSESLRVNRIDLNDPLRQAIPEREAIAQLFALTRQEIKRQGCHRALIAAHNAAFDAGFLRAAVLRADLKRDPFHPFTTLDTAALAMGAYGHTVLREACLRAGIDYDKNQAHSALYDAERTAELFCAIINGWNRALGDQAAWLNPPSATDKP